MAEKRNKDIVLTSSRFSSWMYNTHTPTAGTRSADLHPGQDGGSNPPRERARESLLLWFVQLEAANMNIWMARTYTYTHRLVLSTSLSLSILIHEVERYIRFIHNDPWAKSSSSSGAVYQWKWAKRKKRKKISACVSASFGCMTSKEAQRPLRGKKRNNNGAIFKWKPQNQIPFFFFIQWRACNHFQNEPKVKWRRRIKLNMLLPVHIYDFPPAIVCRNINILCCASPSHFPTG